MSEGKGVKCAQCGKFTTTGQVLPLKFKDDEKTYYFCNETEALTFQATRVAEGTAAPFGESEGMVDVTTVDAGQEGSEDTSSAEEISDSRKAFEEAMAAIFAPEGTVDRKADAHE